MSDFKQKLKVLFRSHRPGWLELITFLSFIFSVIAMAPAHIHEDGVSMLCQGRAGYFEDIHPPLVSIIYGFSDWLVKGPVLLFFFNLSVFYFFIHRIIRDFKHRAVRLTLAVLLFVIPTILASYPVIEKNHLTFSIFLIALFLVKKFDRSSISHLAGGTALFTLILLLQHNAIFITLPLLIFAFGRKRFWIPLITSSLLAGFITSSLTDRKGHPMQGIFLHDIWAIAHAQNKYPLKDTHLDLSSKYRQSDMLSLYSPASHNDIIWNSKLRGHIVVFNDFDKFFETFKVWLREVSHHPVTYLIHRSLSYLYLIKWLEIPEHKRTDSLYQSFPYQCWVDDLKLCPQGNHRCREDLGRVEWPGSGLRNDALNQAYIDVINNHFTVFFFNGLIIIIGLLCSRKMYRSHKEVQLYVWIILLDQVILFFTTPAANRRYLLISIFLSILLIGTWMDQLPDRRLEIAEY